MRFFTGGALLQFKSRLQASSRSWFSIITLGLLYSGITFPIPHSLLCFVSSLPYFHENTLLSGVDRAIDVLGCRIYVCAMSSGTQLSQASLLGQTPRENDTPLLMSVWFPMKRWWLKESFVLKLVSMQTKIGKDWKRFLSGAIFEAYAYEDGRRVDYTSIHGSEEFSRYLRIVEELQRVEISDSSREEKLAFFINLYNMMAIHAILVLGHLDGALERRKLFGEFKYVPVKVACFILEGSHQLKWDLSQMYHTIVLIPGTIYVLQSEDHEGQ